MKRFEKILVAFDGSSNSIQALEVAETIAKDQNAQLTVAYVHDSSTDQVVNYDPNNPGALQSERYIGADPITAHPIPTPAYGDEVVIRDNKPDEVIAHAKSKMSTNIDATYEVLTGKPATRLTEYAKYHNIDLIIIGNRGLSGIRKLVMGSVSSKVTNHAECAVFVVK